MIISDTGKVGPGLYVLGTSRMPVYLLDGGRPVIFDAGLSCLGPTYKNDIAKTLDGRSPEILFLTHVHFDHCGSAAYLKKAFPGLKIAGSKQAAEILTRPNALKLMAVRNNTAREGVRKWAPHLVSNEVFQPFTIDRVLSDGDRIELKDGLSVEVLATPGHTRDSLSYYMPKQKILVAAESAGSADVTGYIFSEFLSDYQAYIDSIHRLAGLEVEILCQGHRLVLTGKDAKDFFGRSLQAAGEFRGLLEEFLRSEGGDIQKVIAKIKAIEYDPKPEPRQFELSYLLNIEILVRHIAQRMEKDSNSRPT